MFNFQTISAELENLGGLKTVAEVYQEIAAIYIQKNKEIVLESRNFYDGLLEIFNEIMAAHKKIHKILPQKNAKNLKKKAMVLMSANAALYGEIVEKVFQKFESDALIEKTDRDLIVMGKFGKAMMDRSRVREEYKYFDFPDMQFDLTALKPIIELFSAYEEVAIYYGSFRNLANQVPAVKNVRETAEAASSISEKKNAQKGANYIFEPSLEKLYGFFEAEIFASIIEQLSYDFALSKLSSRALLLDNVIGNIEKNSKRILLLKQKLEHDAKNKKQADSFPSILQAINFSY